MELSTKNTFDFSISHQLQRLMIVFMLLSSILSTFAENNWSAKVSVRLTQNNTGGGTIYINEQIKTDYEENDINENDTRQIKLKAEPLFHSEFKGWYSNSNGTGELIDNDFNEITVTLNKNAKTATCYAYFYAEKFDGEKFYENYNNQWFRIMLNNAQEIKNGTYTFKLKYPCENISYEAWLSDEAGADHFIKVDLTNEKENLADGNDNLKSNRYYSKEKTINTSAEQAVFSVERGTTGNKTFYVDNIYAKIVPHTKLVDANLPTNGLSFNTALTDPDGETQTIDFYSFLTGSQGMKISIVDVKDKDGNPITIEGLSLNRTSVEENVLEKIGENKYSFTLTFEPKQIITNAKCIIRINNPGAVDNPTLDIPVTLNSTLEVPTLNLDASGYTFAKLSWNAVEGAESYNVYDGDTKIGNYTTTTATITGLNYNTNHSYTVTSVVGSAESNKSDAETVNCPAYPSITGISTNAEQNQVTVNWNAVTITPIGHTVKQYHIRLYQPSTAGTFIDATTTTGTSCTFTGLTDNTQYTVYIDVEYQYTLNGVNITDTDWLWSSKSFTTTSFTPSDVFDGVFMYQGKWYRANLNSNIDISSNTLNTAKEKVYTMSLNYPCEPKVDFQINTTWLVAYGTADIKIDESKTGNWDDTKNIHAESYNGENQSGTTNISNYDVKALQFYCDGGANSSEYVHDIKLQIASHTKMYTESVSFNTPVTNTNPDEQKIEFQSVLTANNGLKFEIVEKDGNNTYKATTLSNDVITLYLNNSYKGQSFHIQSNNTLVKHKDTNKAQGESVVAAGNWDVTVKFNPDNLFEKEVFVRITNEGAKVNPVIYIPVALKSSLEAPTLKCDASGYTFAQLSWNPIEGAESYNIYDNGTKVENNITFNGTTATITGLAYGSNHSYTVASVVGSAISNKSNAIAVNCPAYPIVKNLTVSDIQTDKVTISWEQEDRIPNHSYPKYHILVYENGTLKKELETTNTSITLEGLKNTTAHTVKVGVEYYYELNGTQTVQPNKTVDNQWKSVEFKTNDPIEDLNNNPYTGVINYIGVWYYVNLNNDINITSNPMPIKLGYPCNYLKFKAVTEGTTGALSVNNSVGVKQDEVHTYAMPEWSFSNEEHDGNIEIKTTTEAVSLYMYSGTATEVSQLKVRNIWLTIEPHILLKENRFVKNLVLNSEKTATTTAEIDFGEIEIGYNKQVNINFKSFLSVGNINAKITEDNNNVFSLNEGEKEHYIAGNNTLEEIYSNDHSFTITFNPTEAKEENYTGALVIKDDKHTVTITLKGKCIKRTPEITWVNDKYISLGEYLAGAAYSTCGTVKYELVDPKNSNIIGIDNEFNLLEGKEKGENVEIIAKVEASDKWEKAESKATFTVTDKIIQAIEWNQNFNALKVGNEIELTAKAITREIEEENGNEITYSIVDESVAKIVEGNKLQIVSSGYTYITAHQQGNEEYAPTYMTKLVFVIETAGNSENCLALEDIEEKIYGNGEILSTQGGLNWGPFEFEENLTTLGDKLSFKTTKVTGQTFNTTGDYLIITDDLGNLVYNSNLGKTETNIQLPDPEAKKLFFTLGGNLKVSISNIKVTPAKYITPDKNSIAFSETKVDNKAIEEIDFDWANQSDLVIATIEDGEAGIFSVDTKTAIFGNPECGKYGTSTVKVIFSPKEEKEYTANLVLYIGDQPVPQKIPIKGKGKKAKQSIYWLNISDLTTADKEINLAHTSASTQQPITYTIISDVNDVVQLNDDHTITIVGEGTFILQAKQEGNTSYYATEITEKKFTATIGNLIFDNKEKDNEWTTIRNWKPESRLNLRRNIAPDEEVEINLLVAAPLIIKNNTEVETNKQLSIVAEKRTVTVEPQGRLKVNTIDGTNGDNLIFQSSADGNGAFVFASGTPTPSATVEMYSNAEYGTTATDGHHPEWQYVGVAVNGAKVGDFEYNNERSAWLLKWTEAENVTGDPWTDEPLADNTTLIPWAGYSISQPEAKTYSMKGVLMNGDHTYELTRTTKEGAEKQDPDCGFNLLANSYTAPIDITKLKASNFVNADACIILYNTGTYADWESQQTTLGQNPGQLTAIPVESSRAIAETGLPTTIASMQAFFVKANTTGATFTVNYNEAVAGATNHGNQMRAPRAEKEFNVLKITIEGENTRDQLFLLENENTSKAYDNGYEAYKIFDAPRGHQMYATCEYGYASIDCSESFVGQTIGLKGDNEGEKLTISFDTDRLENYNSLFLYDKLTGEYINIIAGETYTFFGIKGANDNRFSIVTNPIDKNQTPPFVVIGDELAFDRAQIDTENANIYIYDTSGRLLKVDKINPYENYNIPDMPEGIYLVSINGYTTKIVKK